jgi:cytoskeletal protein CcmA (bactofilin family)
MFFKSKKKSREIQQIAAEPSFIARDTSLDGNIICDGEIHIDGAIRGSVQAHTCLIDTHGEVHGEVSAQVIYVRGRVIGPLDGAHVYIYAGAHVEGNVTNETISIENGAYVYGSIRHGGPALQAPTIPKKLILNPPMLNLEMIESAEEPVSNIQPLKPTKIRS